MTSKIKVGDKIHVEYSVYSLGLGIVYASLENSPVRSGICLRTDNPKIVKHIPKPYEPEPGHVVCNQGGFHWKVLAVNCGRAWCRSTDCNDERLFDFNQLTFYGFGDDKS